MVVGFGLFTCEVGWLRGLRTATLSREGKGPWTGAIYSYESMGDGGKLVRCAKRSEKESEKENLWKFSDDIFT